MKYCGGQVITFFLQTFFFYFNTFLIILAWAILVPIFTLCPEKAKMDLLVSTQNHHNRLILYPPGS